MAPASKASAAAKAYKYQLPPGKKSPRVENNEEHIYKFEIGVKEGKFRESPEVLVKKGILQIAFDTSVRKSGSWSTSYIAHCAPKSSRLRYRTVA